MIKRLSLPIDLGFRICHIQQILRLQGLRKPDPKCYKAISDHLGVPPEQLVLIDDRQVNVVSALECGWNALLFSNIGILERDLRVKRILEKTPRRDSG